MIKNFLLSLLVMMPAAVFAFINGTPGETTVIELRKNAGQIRHHNAYTRASSSSSSSSSTGGPANIGSDGNCVFGVHDYCKGNVITYTGCQIQAAKLAADDSYNQGSCAAGEHEYRISFTLEHVEDAVDNDVYYGWYQDGKSMWAEPKVPGQSIRIASTFPEVVGANDDTLRHGFVINPTNTSSILIDGRMTSSEASLFPGAVVNTTTTPIASVLKGYSRLGVTDVRNATAEGAERSGFWFLRVLTIVKDMPANYGADQFRPNYYGPTKYQFSRADVDLTRLPNMPNTSGKAIPVPRDYSSAMHFYSGVSILHDWASDFSGTETHKNLVDFDILSGYTFKSVGRPLKSHGYAVANPSDVGITQQQKFALVYNLFQAGVDEAGVLEGMPEYKVPNGGHNMGRIWDLLLAASLDTTNTIAGIFTSRVSPTEGGIQPYPEMVQITRNPEGTVLYGPVDGAGGKSFQACTDQYNSIEADPRQEVDSSHPYWQWMLDRAAECSTFDSQTSTYTINQTCWDQYESLIVYPAAYATDHDGYHLYFQDNKLAAGGAQCWNYDNSWGYSGAYQPITAPGMMTGLSCMMITECKALMPDIIEEFIIRMIDNGVIVYSGGRYDAENDRTVIEDISQPVRFENPWPVCSGGANDGLKMADSANCPGGSLSNRIYSNYYDPAVVSDYLFMMYQLLWKNCIADSSCAGQ